ISGAEVRRLYIERSGIIRESVVNQLSFTHRTFQEYLAANALVDEGDIGVLIEHAHTDLWIEIIILASGLASRKVRESLIQALISRGDIETKHRHQLHHLAVSCLETSLELSSKLSEEVEKRLSSLIPPKNMTDAKALASAGEL